MSDETTTEETTDETTDDTETGGDEELSPEAARAELKRARDEAAKYRRRAKAAETAAERERAKGLSESEKAIEQARAEGRAEATQRANQAIVSSAAVAAAAGKLANPRIASRLIDLSDIEVDDDGNVDDAELDRRIDALLKSDPYLAPREEPTRRGSGGTGTRQQSSTVGSMEQQVRAKLGI